MVVYYVTILLYVKPPVMVGAGCIHRFSPKLRLNNPCSACVRKHEKTPQYITCQFIIPHFKYVSLQTSIGVGFAPNSGDAVWRVRPIYINSTPETLNFFTVTPPLSMLIWRYHPLTPSSSCLSIRRASLSSSRFRRLTYEHKFPPGACSMTRWILFELSAYEKHHQTIFLDAKPDERTESSYRKINTFIFNLLTFRCFWQES